MSYQSVQFLIFVLVVLIVYYMVGQRRQKNVLILANLTFYCFAGFQYLPFLAVTLFSSFLSAKSIGCIYQETDAQIRECADPSRKKELRAEGKAKAKKTLALGMILPIALLVFCKYVPFLLSNLNILFSLFHIPQIRVFRMILPLGISFYTFMALSYVLDVYWRRYEAEVQLLNYAVYLSYFPHIVQGPIDRFREFRNQIQYGVMFDSRQVVLGAELMLWGFFKKLVVADRVGMIVDGIFGHWRSYGSLALIGAVVLYSIQIYADFSGCIDIVTGVSQMLGIRLRKNFNHPYLSRTMGEFWRRWHISLQEWFKDYIYYPVSASTLVRTTKKRFRDQGNPLAAERFATCFPIFVVWMISGIWHGAAWKYVAWGLFHASLLIGNVLLEPAFNAANRRLGIRVNHPLWRLWQMIRTFILCCVGRLFFRAYSLREAFAMLVEITRSKPVLADMVNPMLKYCGQEYDLPVTLFAILILIVVDIIQERTHLREALEHRSTALRWFLIYACLFFVLIFGVYGSGYDVTGFIYEQF